MSLEQVIADNTAAIKELTAFLKSSASGSAIAAGTGKAAPTTDKAPASEEGEKPATTRRRASANKDKVPTAKDVEKVATKFLEDAEKDEDEYAERRAFIKKLAGEFGIQRLTLAEESDRAEIIRRLNEFAEDNGGGDENSSDDSGI